MGSAEVIISGQRYKLTGEQSSEYIKGLAEYVDAKLREINECSPHITPLKATILTAVNIADELMKTKAEFESITKDIRMLEDKTDNFIKLFD